MQTFVKADEPKLIELGGGQSRKIRAYNQEMMLVEVIFESGAVGSDHSHEHTQISYVLSGEFTYQSRARRAGCCRAIPSSWTAARCTAAPA